MLIEYSFYVEKFGLLEIILHSFKSTLCCVCIQNHCVEDFSRVFAVKAVPPVASDQLESHSSHCTAAVGKKHKSLENTAARKCTSSVNVSSQSDDGRTSSGVYYCIVTPLLTRSTITLQCCSFHCSGFRLFPDKIDKVTRQKN